MSSYTSIERQSHLTYLDNARVEIDTATDLVSLKEIHDRVTAVHSFCRAAKLSFDITQRCAELKIRCERRAGELLNDRKKGPAGFPSRGQSLAATDAPRLDDLSITKSQSFRWRSLAAIPDEDFERKIDEIKKSRREITGSEMLSFAKDFELRRLQRRGTAFEKAAKAQPDNRLRVFHMDSRPYLRETPEDLTTRPDSNEIADKFESLIIKYANELEGLKSQLAAKFYPRTVAVDKEFACYREIWDSLLELRERIFKLRATVSYREGRPDLREADKKRLLETIAKFCSAFEKNRPFIAPDVFKVIVELRRLESIEEVIRYSYLPAPSREQSDNIRRLLEEFLVGAADEFIKKTDTIEESIRSRLERF